MCYPGAIVTVTESDIPKGKAIPPKIEVSKVIEDSKVIDDKKAGLHLDVS